MSNLKARVALACLKLGYNVKPTHIGSLAGTVALVCGNRENTTDDEIEAALPKLKKEYASHFGFDASLTPDQRLEFANAQAELKRKNGAEAQKREAPGIKLTPVEMSFPPHVRAALADQKKADALAAIEAAKKRKKESA